MKRLQQTALFSTARRPIGTIVGGFRILSRTMSQSTLNPLPLRRLEHWRGQGGTAKNTAVKPITVA